MQLTAEVRRSYLKDSSGVTTQGMKIPFEWTTEAEVRAKKKKDWEEHIANVTAAAKASVMARLGKPPAPVPK